MGDLVKRLREEHGGDWRPVGGTGERYWVNDYGLVYSVRRPRCAGGLLKQWVRSGYMTVCLNEGRSKSLVLVHRIVVEAFRGPIPLGMEVRHRDGDAANNSLCNLALGTRTDNERDKAVHGTLLRGERHPNAKLTWEQVCEIRGRMGIERQHDLAARFGIARSTVQRIQKGERWGHPQ